MDQLEVITGRRQSRSLTARRDARDSSATRREAIAAYRILDTPREPEFDDIVALAATFCGSAMAAISLTSDDGQWFKAETGLGVRELPVAASLCARAASGDEMIVIPDIAGGERHGDDPTANRSQYVRFFAASPLTTPDGITIGTLSVLDRQPRSEFGDVERMALRILAEQIVTRLELRKAIAQRNHHLAAQFAGAEELRWLASHDTLTHLPNRALFLERLAQLIDRPAAATERSALLTLDVDQFKQINDAFGYDAGDALLRTLAARLSSTVRTGDTVARLGGDEFAIILPAIPEDELAAMGDAILHRMREPFHHSGRAIECRASIGIALLPAHADDAGDLARKADVALQASKAAGGGRLEVFRPEMLAEMERQMSMLSLARAALKCEWIVPFYQPKVEIRSGRIVGFEALLRWQRPEGGVQDPATIAAAFDDPELALEISRAMISRVTRDVRGWLAAGIDFGSVAINASAAEFVQEGLAERLLENLREAAIPPELFELEVTESVFLGSGTSLVEHALQTLSAAGVRIALDDFGTGYASLTHLKRFPVDVIKIDRSFVHGLGTDADNAAIIRAVLDLGQSLGISIVAEGIETVPQLDFLRRNGCDLGQGFLFGAAAPAARVPAIVSAFAARGRSKEAAGFPVGTPFPRRIAPRTRPTTAKRSAG